MQSPDADSPTPEPEPTPPEPGKRAFLAGLGLVLLTLLAFLPVLDHGFVNYDDPVYVTSNPYVRAGLMPQSVFWALGAYVSSNYHPVTVLSHMLDCQLFGLNPRGHHLTSLLIHLANTMLLFLLLRRLTSTSQGRLGSEAASLWVSAIATALFAVHPLRVETVAWISDRKDLLSTFFWLVALLAYLAFTRRRTVLRYLVVAMATALALLSKATAVTLPCVLLLLDFWPLGRLPTETWRQAARALPRLVLEKLPLFALSLVAGRLALTTQAEAWVSVEAVSFSHRAANAAVSYVTYLAKTLVPHDLAVFYPYTPIAPVKALGAAALIAAVTVAAVVCWRRAPYLFVGWFWFLGVLAPVIGITQVGNQAMADRYTYVPSIGILIALAWGLTAWAGKITWRRRSLVAASLAAVLVLPVATRLQLRHWENSVTLFRHALEVTPPNVVAHLNLAEGLRAAGQLDEAVLHYQAALTLEPTRAEAHAGMGTILMNLGRLDEAVRVLERAVELAPNDAKMHHALAAVLDTAGRADEAITHLERAVELRPEFRAAHLGLVDLLGKRGDQEGARRHLEAAMALGDAR